MILSSFLLHTNTEDNHKKFFVENNNKTTPIQYNGVLTSLSRAFLYDFFMSFFVLFIIVHLLLLLLLFLLLCPCPCPPPTGKSAYHPKEPCLPEYAPMSSHPEWSPWWPLWAATMSSEVGWSKRGMLLIWLLLLGPVIEEEADARDSSTPSRSVW